MRISLFLVVLFLPWAGCSSPLADQPPISDSTYVELMIDLHLATGRSQILQDTTLSIRDSIFAKYGIDSTQFEAIGAYYARNPSQYLDTYDTILDKLSSERYDVEVVE